MPKWFSRHTCKLIKVYKSLVFCSCCPISLWALPPAILLKSVLKSSSPCRLASSITYCRSWRQSINGMPSAVRFSLYHDSKSDHPPISHAQQRQYRPASSTHQLQPRSILRRPTLDLPHSRDIRNATPDGESGKQSCNNTSTCKKLVTLDPSLIYAGKSNKGEIGLFDQEHKPVRRAFPKSCINSIDVPSITIASILPASVPVSRGLKYASNSFQTKLGGDSFDLTHSKGTKKNLTLDAGRSLSLQTKQKASTSDPLCKFELCNEGSLDWSTYCYKHQCRGFLCYSSVTRNGVAFCILHYRPEDPPIFFGR